MSKAQTPSPHASKKHDKRCDSCQSYVSELDPHPVCLKCVPRECNKELPCSHCAPLSLDAWKRWERQQASRKSSSTTKGSKGDSAKGGSKSGKAAAPSGHCPVTPSSSKAESPGKSRLAALESGFSSFRTEIASMFASLQGRLTASHPPGLATEEARHRDGGARGVETCADDPLASQQPCLGLLGPEALPLVGRTPGCDLSDPSHVMEPRGTTNHMAMAMDRGEILKVHGLQFGFGQTGVNQTTQRGRAALTSGYGSEGRGEVSLGTGSSAFTGHQSQPEDAARQPVLVLDSAPSGVSALPGVSALSGSRPSRGPRASRASRPSRGSRPSRVSQHYRLSHMGIPPWKWKWGRLRPASSAPRPCRTPGACHFQVSLSCPGPRLPSRESGHPRDSPAPLWGPANFQGRGKRQPSGRHRPSTLVGPGRCPTGQRPP